MKTLAVIYYTAVAIACVYAAAYAISRYAPAPTYPCLMHKHCHKLP